MRCDAGGNVVRAALVIAVALVAACPGASPTPPGPAAPIAAPGAAPAPAVEQPTEVQAVEAGFTHCCGNASYRIEIECGNMVKRCYSSETGAWRQTYGRHCLASLGEACYLQDCDAKCQ
ncbi:MAG TPA: hypothetical protein VKZ63_07830 [Kofleriaceae bacterium]|nr:hypothetical protein [Kofleriaceae bacterium]